MSRVSLELAERASISAFRKLSHFPSLAVEVATLQGYIQLLQQENYSMKQVLCSVRVPLSPPVAEYVASDTIPTECIKFTTLEEMRELIEDLQEKVRYE